MANAILVSDMSSSSSLLPMIHSPESPDLIRTNPGVPFTKLVYDDGESVQWDSDIVEVLSESSSDEDPSNTVQVQPAGAHLKMFYKVCAQSLPPFPVHLHASSNIGESSARSSE